MAQNRSRKPKSQKTRRAALKITSDELVSREERSFAETGVVRRAEISAQRGDYQALPRPNNDAPRASGTAIAQCAEEVETRRSAKTIVPQHKRSSERVERPRKYVAAELAEGLERTELAEADTREAQAAPEVGAEGGRTDQARVPGQEEMNNLSLAVGRMESEMNDLVSTLFQGAAGRQPLFRKKVQLGG